MCKIWLLLSQIEMTNYSQVRVEQFRVRSVSGCNNVTSISRNLTVSSPTWLTTTCVQTVSSPTCLITTCSDSQLINMPHNDMCPRLRWT